MRSRINDNLQAIMSTLYDYWFVQFDFPDENGRPYKSSGGKMVWSERLNRDLPAGWEVCSIIDNPISKPIKPGVVPFQTKTYLATADVTGTDIGTGTEIEYDTRVTGEHGAKPLLGLVCKNESKHEAPISRCFNDGAY